ncbi:hypothetical protein HDU76_000735, partial [Blyttiomyces sp. JEL0837]
MSTLNINLAFAPSALLAQLTNNPINWVLGCVALYLAVSLRSSGTAQLPPPKHSEVIELRNFTPKELIEFNGRDGKKIYMGVNGRVYDVSAGAGFYGPGGPYGNFAGRDASRGLAKDSFDEDMLTDLTSPIDKLEDLEADEWESLRNW